MTNQQVLDLMQTIGIVLLAITFCIHSLRRR